MRELTADPTLVAACGLYCGACRAYLNERCPGCAKNEKATWCRVRSCCAEHGWATCAACTEHADPRGCRKYNNVVSKLFGLIFRSNRAACIDQVRRLGLEGHAQSMAGSKRHSLPR